MNAAQKHIHGLSLKTKQRLFPLLFARLIVWVYEEYAQELVLGEVQRPEWVAHAYEFFGRGDKDSLHKDLIAGDGFLIVNGRYSERFVNYEPVGAKWEEMGGTWGGRFDPPDIFHFSLPHGTRR